MPAPKGNIFAIGNSGKPKKYETPEDITKAIDSYFTYIQGEPTIDKESKLKWDRVPESPTVTGLALHIGFASRQSIYDYIKEEEFSYILKRAVTVIENHHEKRMDGDKVAGSIFVLKNMGWADKVDVTSGGEKIKNPLYSVREVIVDKSDEKE